LSGNVIVQPCSTDGVTTVNFIDYEYATPSPAAFDIANHFAEWGGFECEHHLLPTRSQRRDFIREYVRSYFTHLGDDMSQFDEGAETGRLFDEVDVFRGVPGFYWGIWALIQAKISQIDFDYASYAEIRLGEYWAWREESDGSRAASKKELAPRERRWAQEE
jgi:ethanolamine kinase